MGMKLAIVQKNDNNEVDTIDYFENDSKGVTGFIILLNKVLIDNGINLQIGLVKR